MRYLFFVLCLVVSLSACDRFKGDKGDKGDTGNTGDKGTTGATGQSNLLSSKIYTGTPTTNLYSVSCPELTGADNQLVQIFMVLPNSSNRGRIALPWTEPNNIMHWYLTGTSTIVFSTYNPAGNPSTALYQTTWGQCNYRIEIRTFSTASAAIAYKQSLSKPKDTINRLVGTD